MYTLQNHADHSVQTKIIYLLIMNNGVKIGMNVLARWQMTYKRESWADCKNVLIHCVSFMFFQVF